MQNREDKPPQTRHPGMAVPEDLRTLRVEEAAEVLGVHAETIRRWVREGQLRAARWGGRLHFTAEAVREFQAACQVQVPDPAEFIRRARRGKACGGGRRTARLGGATTARQD
jgi:excisionase family DNA binding protein